MFKNREKAGLELAKKLKNLKIEKPVVLAIPRGGVVVGRVISDKLGCALDVLVTKKIGAPGNPELAIGAMGQDKSVAWNYDILSQLGLKEDNLTQEIKNAKLIMQNYNSKFKITLNKNIKNRTIILTDDGIATGATMEAAIRYVLNKHPKKIIIAAPVAPAEVVARLKNLIDEIIVLETPAWFSAVGQFYEDFPQISDEEVLQLLKGDL